MALITTLLGDMDESLLVKTIGIVDTEQEYTIWTEYCLVGCEGEAHRTGQPQGVGLFCPQHVHRSLNMTLKQGVSITTAVEGF